MKETKKLTKLQRKNTPDTTHHVDIPWAAKQQKLKEYIKTEWANRWNHIQGHTQTKLFLHTPDPNKSRGILRLSRGYLTIIVRAITGHNFLGKHQNHINPNISKVCRFCKEHEKTFFHFISTCPTLRQLRESIFHDKPHPQDNSWSIHKLKTFILEPSIYSTLTSKAGLALIELEPHEIGLTSDTDSSL